MKIDTNAIAKSPSDPSAANGALAQTVDTTAVGKSATGEAEVSARPPVATPRRGGRRHTPPVRERGSSKNAPPEVVGYPKARPDDDAHEEVHPDKEEADEDDGPDRVGVLARDRWDDLRASQGVSK